MQGFEGESWENIFNHPTLPIEESKRNFRYVYAHDFIFDHKQKETFTALY